MVLVRRSRTAAPAPGSRSRRGPLSFAMAAAVLILSGILLLTGVYVHPVAADGPCPARTSIAAYADGHLLLVRVEPSDGATALVHLCAPRTIGPVRAWSVRLDGNGPGPADPVAVVQVAEGVALAVAPLTAGRRTGIGVVVTPATGRRLTFATNVTAN